MTLIKIWRLCTTVASGFVGFAGFSGKYRLESLCLVQRNAHRLADERRAWRTSVKESSGQLTEVHFATFPCIHPEYQLQAVVLGTFLRFSVTSFAPSAHRVVATHLSTKYAPRSFMKLSTRFLVVVQCSCVFALGTREVHKIRFVANFEDLIHNLTPPTLYSHKEKKPKIIVTNFQYQLITKYEDEFISEC